MDDIISKITQELSDDDIRVITYRKFHDGIAVAARDEKIKIYWYDLSGKLLFKSSSRFDMDLECNDENSIHMHRVNEWLKVYTDKNLSYPILVEKRNYARLLGYIFDREIRRHKYNELLDDIEVKENILIYRGKTIEFQYHIDDVAYFDHPQPGFLVLTNLQTLEYCEDHLTLYAYREDGELLWKLSDYSKVLKLPDSSRLESIHSFDVYDDKIKAAAPTLLLYINLSNGEVIYGRPFGRFEDKKL